MKHRLFNNTSNAEKLGERLAIETVHKGEKRPTDYLSPEEYTGIFLNAVKGDLG